MQGSVTRAHRQGSPWPLANPNLPGCAANRIDARCVIDGPINGESFLAYIEQVLARRISPATSSSSTISAAIRERRCGAPIRSAGAKQFFLPPYRSDLTPIEQVFAKINKPAVYRRRAHRRSRPETRRRLSRILHHAGMRQRLRQLRLSFTIKQTCSGSLANGFTWRCSIWSVPAQRQSRVKAALARTTR
jgi:transposase